MTTRYRQSSQVAARVIDGQAYIVTAGDSKLHTLNRTATIVWEMAGAGCTAHQAAQALVDRFEVELDAALTDVTACIDDLVARHILVTGADDPPPP